MSEQPHILLAVTGSVAAFKAAALASEMVKRGWDVRTVLTAGGAKFVTPLTFHGITGHEVATDLWGGIGESPMSHLDLANWADLLLVAPASAGAIARLALGLPSDLLGALALAYDGPLVVVPAMEPRMYHHPATLAHLATLQSRGAVLVGPASGRLASGAVGEGRMVEPAEIVDAVAARVSNSNDMSGLHVLVTAGPTYEAIDPVRFLGNRSSGKMGYAVAEAAVARGADVTLVTGPTALQIAGVRRIDVESSREMLDAVLAHVAEADVTVMAAAVADFRPSSIAANKLKRAGTLTIELLPTEDIAAAASEANPRSFHVGFALETEGLQAAARAKLQRKKLDLVVANELSADHNPFGADTNIVTFVTQDAVVQLPPLTKRELADRLWDAVLKQTARRP